jgi:muconolactone delta-isomerase
MYIACITTEDTRSLDGATVGDLRRREGEHYRRLAAEGLLHVYYPLREERGNLLVFAVASFEQMHRQIMLGPMALYQRTSVYPLMSIQALGDLTGRMAAISKQEAAS